MDEYSRGFEDALDLVNSYIEKYKEKIPQEFVLQIKEIVQNARDKKVANLKKELLLTGKKISTEGNKTKQ